METVKSSRNLFSFLKIGFCVGLMAFSSSVFAEYYVVYPAAAPMTMGCNTCGEPRFYPRVHHRPCASVRYHKPKYHTRCHVRHRRVYHRAARQTWASPCPIDGMWVTNSCTGCDAMEEATSGCGSRETITYEQTSYPYYDGSFDRRTADDVWPDPSYNE